MATLTDVLKTMGLPIDGAAEMEAILDYANVVVYVNKTALTPDETGIVDDDITTNYDPIGLTQSFARTYQRGVGEVGEIGSEGGIVVVNEQTKTMSLSRLLHREGSLLAQLYQSVIDEGKKDLVYHDVTKALFRKNKFHMIMVIYNWNAAGTGKDPMGKILYQGCKATSLGAAINWRENITVEGVTIVWDKTVELSIE